MIFCCRVGCEVRGGGDGGKFFVGVVLLIRMVMEVWGVNCDFLFVFFDLILI